MNVIDLPSTWLGWLHLLVGFIRATARQVLLTPSWLTVVLLLAVVLVAALTARLGTNEHSPILTEDDRKASR